MQGTSSARRSGGTAMAPSRQRKAGNFFWRFVSFCASTNIDAKLWSRMALICSYTPEVQPAKNEMGI